MTDILLIRHGLTDAVGHSLAGRRSGILLNATGRRQAEDLAGLTVDAIYASPLERTMESAAPLATRLKLPVVTLKEFIEVDFGAWTGMTIEELTSDEDWGRFNRFRSAVRPPGGEFAIEIQARVVGALDTICINHPDQTVAVFSHQDVIKAALLHYLGMPLDLFLRLDLPPGSVSRLRLGPDWVQVLSINGR